MLVYANRIVPSNLSTLIVLQHVAIVLVHACRPSIITYVSLRNTEARAGRPNKTSSTMGTFNRSLFTRNFTQSMSLGTVSNSNLAVA